jgi:substrate-binding family protein
MWSRYRTVVLAGLIAAALIGAIVAIPVHDDGKVTLAESPSETPTTPPVGGSPSTLPTLPGATVTPTPGLSPSTGPSAVPTGGFTSTPPKPRGVKPGPAGNTRGVTGSKIKIGVAIPDLEAFARISSSFDVGNQQQQMDAILDGWRKKGLLPIFGRDIEFVYRDFDIFQSSEKVAACQDLIEEEKVFTVIAGRFFGEGAECVASRFKTPMVTINSDLQSVYGRLKPYYFTIRSPWERLFKNWIAWADAGGRLKGKKIGLFYENEVKPAVDTGIKRELARRGYKITSEIGAAGAGVGTQQDQLAVRRFQQDGVNLVLMVTGGTSAANFMSFAETQDFHPTYIDTDYGEHTTDAATTLFPSNQYDKTFAMTTTRIGEIAARMRLPKETTDCVSNYERFSGDEVGPRSPETAEYNNVVVSCDLANAMLQGIRLAGRGLGHLSLIRGLESIRNFPLAAHQQLTFDAGHHYGVTTQRTAQWTRGCRCWKAIGAAFRRFTL